MAAVEHEMLVDLAARPAATSPAAAPDTVGADQSTSAVAAEVLTLVIPMFDEADRIVESVRTLALSPLNGPHVAFCFVDDGSADATVELTRTAIEAFGLHRARVVCVGRNVGKGGAIRLGVEVASTGYIGFLDADLSLDPAEVHRAFARLRATGADLLVGHRVVGGHQPKLRRVASLTFRRLTELIVKSPVQDTQCAMKLFRAPVAKDIFASLGTNGFAFDVEILGIAARRKYRFEEVPVGWVHQDGSKVNPLLDGLKMLREVLRIRHRLRSI